MRASAIFAFVGAAWILPISAAEPGKHSPYVIGPVIRDQAQRQIVIPVHYYWKKGDKDTNTRMELTIEFQGKSYTIGSSDTFVTSSQTGLQSVTSEFVIRDWKPGREQDDKPVPELVSATELSISFQGSADGALQKAAGIFPIVDLAAETPSHPKKGVAPLPAKGQRR